MPTKDQALAKLTVLHLLTTTSHPDNDTIVDAVMCAKDYIEHHYLGNGDFLCDIVVTYNTPNGRLSKSIPLFILPQILGLLSLKFAKRTCIDIYQYSGAEVHGSVMDWESNTLSW